jgi:short/branched chain acyl-CoA dehydrogenase
VPPGEGLCPSGGLLGARPDLPDNLSPAGRVPRSLGIVGGLCPGGGRVSFQLTGEQRELKDTVGRFAREVVAPVIGGYYERGEFPYQIVAEMGKLGLFGLPFDEEYGGMGGDYFALGLALEELARVDSSVAITLEAGVSLGAMPIYRFGTAEQRQRWLPELCAGERLAAFGLTEAGGGSDIPGGMRTTARLEAGEWVVDGSKAFITNSGTSITSLVTVLAITGRDDRGGKEISSIIIPNGTAGFVPGPEYSKVGWCASDTRELSFTGCRVPGPNLLGERGRGYAQFLRILDEGRVAIAALATGLAQGCVDECVTYARQREAFGRRLEQHQAIQFTIADMETRVHAARLAWYDAAARLVAGEPIKKQSAIAKLIASNAAMDNARAATQVFGGYGFMNSSPVGRFYRDAKILEIGEGTSEVQRMLIARELGLDR